MMEHFGNFLGNQWNVLPDTHAAWPLEWEKTVIKSIEFGTPFSWVCLRKHQKNKQTIQKTNPQVLQWIFPLGTKKHPLQQIQVFQTNPFVFSAGWLNINGELVGWFAYLFVGSFLCEPFPIVDGQFVIYLSNSILSR